MLFFPHLNVFENVAYGLNVMNISKDEIEKRVSTVLGTSWSHRSLKHVLRTSFQAVSSSVLLLQRALVLEPKVLLLDEPLSNLDAKLREQMRTEIRRIQQKLGITTYLCNS